MCDFLDGYEKLRIPNCRWTAHWPNADSREPSSTATSRASDFPGVVGRLGESRRGPVRVERGIIEGVGVHEYADIFRCDLVPRIFSAARVA